MAIDVDELKRLHAEGWSDPDMAVRFDVTAMTVKRYREALRLKRNAQRRIWSDAEVDKIRTLAAQGLTAAAIAREMGERVRPIRALAAYRGIRLGQARTEASAELSRRIEALVREGLGPAAIGREIGLSAKQVAGRIQYMRRKGRLPPAGMSPQVLIADATRRSPQRVAAVPPKPVVEAEPDPLDHLRARFGVEVVQAVARIGRKGSYRRLSEVAATHALPIRSVEGIWHRVRAS